MAGKIDARLKELGIELPPGLAPAANYVPYVISGNQLFLSGQISSAGGNVITGKLGAGMDVEAGQAAARQCALNLLAQAKAALGGDLDRVARIVRLGGFVNGAPDFVNHPEVVNGASDLMVEVFGDAGRHARAAVGCASLPRGCAVEVEAVFEITG
jgi:enamine deaminase RidA (YjgF/YER057c/UK114 family)